MPLASSLVCQIDMDFLQKLMTSLSSIVTFLIRFFPESNQPRSEEEQQPPTSSSDIEMPQLQTQTSPSSPSPSNDDESSEPESPSSASASTPPTPPNLKLQLEPVYSAQQHLQLEIAWQNAVVAFCFSYPLNVSLQSVVTAQSNHDHRLPFPLALLSFLVLITFTFKLVAFFIHRSCKRTSQALKKIAYLLAAAAFCHALSVPLSFELQCTVWAVFLITFLIIVIFICLNPNAAWC